MASSIPTFLFKIYSLHLVFKMILSTSSSYLGFNCRLVVNKFLLAVFQNSVGSKYAIRVFFPRMSDGLLRWPVSWLSHIFETAFPEKKIGINCVLLLPPPPPTITTLQVGFCVVFFSNKQGNLQVQMKR